MNAQTAPNPARVFVVQEGAHDYTPAERFGSIEFLSVDEITPTSPRISPRNAEIIRRMRVKLLSDYVPGRDFVLLNGSPIAIAWVCLILGDAFKSSIEHQFLKWDSQSRAYRPYRVVLNDSAAY